MAFVLDARAIEMFCDGLSDGVVLFRQQRVAVANDGACGLLGVSREFLLGADADEVLGRLGMPAPWLMRLRAGDSVTWAPSGAMDSPLRLRWIHLPDAGADEVAVLVVQDVRLARALRRSQDEHARDPATASSARIALPDNEVLAYLSAEVRRSHLDFEELSVLVLDPADRGEADALADAIAQQLRGGDRVGLASAASRPTPADRPVTFVNFPAATDRAHVVVVLPCTPAPGRDALAMRLAGVLASGSRANHPIGAATLEVRAASRRTDDRPRDGARALLERALSDLARQRAERAGGRAA